MTRRLILLALLPSFVLSSIAEQWWGRKPYLEWTVKETEALLSESPWVRACSAGFLKQSRKDGTRTYSVNYPLQLVYRIRVITARPVREALLRRMSLPPEPAARPWSATVSVAELPGETGRGRLEKFLASNPADVRVIGDDKHIILGLTVTMAIPSASDASGRMVSPPPRPADLMGRSWEEFYPDELMPLESADLAETTFLSTGTGRRIALARYDPPGVDQVGAKFYFSRTLPDGSPLVTPEDKELQFETQIGRTSIKVKFDLRKMIYKGKLET